MNNDFLELVENLGWSYTLGKQPVDGQVCLELEKYSPQGQDFIATIWYADGDKQDFIRQLREYWVNFDPCEEAAKWIDETGHGTNGAPYDLRNILDDMEDCQSMLRELYFAFCEADIPSGLFRGLRPDERYAVSQILDLVRSIKAHASFLPHDSGYDCIRNTVERMTDRFEEQFINVIGQSLPNQ